MDTKKYLRNTALYNLIQREKNGNIIQLRALILTIEEKLPGLLEEYIDILKKAQS